MITRNINFNSFIDCGLFSSTFLTFTKFTGSRTFRVYQIPAMYDTTELRQVLNTLCKKHLNGTWYFVFDVEAMSDVGLILLHMDILHLFVEPDLSYKNYLSDDAV